MRQDDGSYVATYKFGGMFPFDTNSRAPRVSVAAPGYAPVCYDLGRTEDTAQVKRSDCAPASSDCFELDFYLAPEGGGDSR